MGRLPGPGAEVLSGALTCAMAYVGRGLLPRRGILLEGDGPDRGNEPRWVAVGTHPATQKVIAVVYTMREGRHRIIWVRRARENEEEDYRKHLERQASETRLRGEARPHGER